MVFEMVWVFSWGWLEGLLLLEGFFLGFFMVFL